MANDKRLYRNILEKLLVLIDAGEYPAGAGCRSEQ